MAIGMNANHDIAKLISLADTYRHHVGIARSTCSLRAANNGALFGLLAEGRCGLTLRRRDTIIQWFADNWPTDLSWPTDVPRPAATGERAA